MTDEAKKWLDKPAVVIDHGATKCVIGMGGETHPRTTVPTVVGRPKESVAMRIPDLKSCYIGSEAELKGDKILNLRHPLYHGMVDNWDDMAKVWGHIFSKHLRVNPEDHPMLLTEAPLVPIINREKMCQVMFETFNPPAVYIGIHQVLFMYATGKLDGIVLDSGHDLTYCVPIYKGYSISRAITRLNFGGRDLTDYLAKSLASKCGEKCVRRQSRYGSAGGDAKVGVWEAVARKIKENYCYVAADYKQEWTKMKFEEKGHAKGEKITQTYELPDGQVVNIDSERFKVPESLFQPELIGQPDSPALHQAIHLSIEKLHDKMPTVEVDADIAELQKTLYSNVYLTGGNCRFPGITERMRSEIYKHANRTTGLSLPVNVIGVPDADGYSSASPVPSAWLGGSILSSLSSFQDMWISRKEYDETGPSIVHQKCVQATPDGDHSSN
ncbi:actin-3-like [Ischnura elegans]|uniref:actin-3-like n=1 Tax=Ischnura elegans TaxID=197161 RepID=UPI001ED8BF31|nr:actin-3-like [Ischnura elegans]XP_046396506.1 actin-3-like [Ischnura elegans]